MAQRLEMADAHHGLLDRLAVEHAAWAEADVEPEAFLQGRLKHFDLNCAHDLHLKFLKTLVPLRAEQRVLVS